MNKIMLFLKKYKNLFTGIISGIIGFILFSNSININMIEWWMIYIFIILLAIHFKYNY